MINNCSKRIINKKNDNNFSNDDDDMLIEHQIKRFVYEKLLILKHTFKIHDIFFNSIFSNFRFYSFANVFDQKRMQKFDFQFDCDRKQNVDVIDKSIDILNQRIFQF